MPESSKTVVALILGKVEVPLFLLRVLMLTGVICMLFADRDFSVAILEPARPIVPKI